MPSFRRLLRATTLAAMASMATLVGFNTLTSEAKADACMDRADRQARIAYQDTYERVLRACRDNTNECRSNFDCSFGQTCTNGRCVAQPTECVRNCTARYANGDCYRYGQDYCEYDPICIPNCAARYSNGSCFRYGADLCGREPLSCIKRCTARYANGDCSQYGTDNCGPAPTCAPVCTARYANGECYQWGPDRCTTGNP